MKNVSWLSASDLGLFERLTGQENIELFANVLKIPFPELKKKIDKWSRLNSFKSALRTKFFQSSSGMKQILRCFIMTLHSPEFFVWDEPFRSLDIASQEFLSNEFWSHENYTIVYSNHLSGSPEEKFITKKINLEESTHAN